MPLPTRLQFYMPARVKYDSIRHELSVDILHLIVTPLTNSNPANMSTSSCTRMPRHTPFSRSISHSPSCLCFVPTSMFPLQLSSPHERRHRKLNHRTFHVVPSVTILMTAVRTDRTLKEEGADGKMTISSITNQLTGLLDHIKPRTISNTSPRFPCMWHISRGSLSRMGFSNERRPRASGTSGIQCK